MEKQEKSLFCCVIGGYFPIKCVYFEIFVLKVTLCGGFLFQFVSNVAVFDNVFNRFLLFLFVKLMLNYDNLVFISPNLMYLRQK